MGDVLIEPTTFDFPSFPYSLAHILAFKRPGYEVGGAARALLVALYKKELQLQPQPNNHDGSAVHATQEQLGLSPREVHFEQTIMDRLATVKAMKCSFAFGLRLWMAPHDTLVGRIYMDPIRDHVGDLVRLEIQQEGGVRWLRSVYAGPRRRWSPETPVIYMAQ